MNDKEIKIFENWLADNAAKAKEKDGKLHRVKAGWYLVWLNGELIEIYRVNHDEPHPCNGWWISKESTGKWYNDPYPTLMETKKRLGVS